MMRNQTTTRLTESRLRSIIREELSKLKSGRKSLRESIDADLHSLAPRGAHVYYDFDFADEEGELGSVSRGSDVTDIVRDIFNSMPPHPKVFGGNVYVDPDVVILVKDPTGPSGWPELRIYGQLLDVERFVTGWAKMSGENHISELRMIKSIR